MDEHRHWVILLAHGSRDPRWRRPFEALAARVAQLAGPEPGVALAYLQLAEPGLEEVLLRCRERRGISALVVPVFMSGGGHLVRDVVSEVERAAAAVDGIEVRCSGALAEEPEVVEAMAAAALRLATVPR